MEQLIWVDYGILAVVGLSIVVSVWRGFMREVLSLTAWIVAFIVALAFVDKAAAFLQPHVSVPSVRLILSFGGLFLITLSVGGLVNVLVAKLVQSTGLTGTDRMLGVVFGALRGVVIVAALVLLASFTPLPQDPWWSRSVLLGHFEPLARWLLGFLPPGFAPGLPYPA